MIAGTPQYMSPEQARGDQVDHRTDLFSLGTVLYTMLAGHSPFRAESAMGVLRRVCDETPRPLREINPHVPEWLEAIVTKLHSKQAVNRFESASEVSTLLQRCLAHMQQPTLVRLPEEVLRLVEKPRKGIHWLLALASFVLFAVATSLVISTNLPVVDRNQVVETRQPSNTQVMETTEEQNWDDGLQTESEEVERELKQWETDTEF